MQIPWVNPYSQTHDIDNAELPTWLNAWLCRRLVTKVEFQDLMNRLADDGPGGASARAAIDFAGSLSAKKSFTQIEERLGFEEQRAGVQEPILDPVEAALRLMEAFDPLTEEEMIEDAEAFISEILGDAAALGMFEDVTVMQEQPKDYYLHTLYLNETMQALVRIFDSARIMVAYMPPDIQRVLDRFDAAVVRTQEASTDTGDDE